jgi:hypothetical protein
MKKSFLISLGIALAAILVIVLIVIWTKDPVFNSVVLPKDNYIINQSSVPYLDTIVAIGMNEIGKSGFSVRIKDLTTEFLDNQSVNGLELGAVIIGSGKNYIIYVDPGLDKKRVIDVLSHEIIHLKQYSSGDLMVIDGVKGLVNWKGEMIEVLELEYSSRPWEIEAFAEQKGLSIQIREILIP